MAFIKEGNWLETLPSPFDIECRGMFCILKITVENPRWLTSDYVEQKYSTFKQIRERLDEEGKMEWMVNNNVPTQFLKFTAYYIASIDKYNILVLVDMPEELQTLFRLTYS